ncbi:DUF2577 domain-containing protein [Bacillus badius]|uniref:DUF2577 domain-containing protein n=1 Tax=Bacillus badius TaxID=1455 RepID=A0ABR5B183_BACBA|nr:DUF2577 domain-containing protein [Bacillus badius]KIL72553.1 hypothetical protein SD78_4138 [Bacillus badius]KIL80738.1 hypothetical protein SD77_0586 [Bacillus badius]MED4715333.1 DUF2577 domain-containing protein [Bacillus badius]
MALGNTIKKIANDANKAESPVRILDADVISDSPLSIRLMKNNKLVFSEEFFIIPESLTDHTVQVQTPRGTETHTILNALKAGDELTVASIQGGGSYYILGRKGK